MRFLLSELGYEADDDFVRMHEEFNKRLLQEARAGNRFIVVVDEAQNLDHSVLETVRLLSDFETPRAKLMTIILAGQPELAGKLASPGLAQLRQRVSIVNRLEPLAQWELKSYLEHRLKVAGYEGDPLFEEDTLPEISRFTEGIPRNINNFCFNALSLACAMRQKTIDLTVVREVMADLDITQHTIALQSDERPVEPPVQRPEPATVASIPRVKNEGALSPAAAKAYMQEVVLKLKNWEQALDTPGRNAGRNGKTGSD
jgi:general secretion pathway protein A